MEAGMSALNYQSEILQLQQSVFSTKPKSMKKTSILSAQVHLHHQLQQPFNDAGHFVFVSPLLISLHWTLIM